MKSAEHYRHAATQMRRLATAAGAESAEILQRVATDLDEIAIDLEDGLVELLHPELMPQQREDHH